MGKKEEVQVVVSAKDLASDALTKIGGILAATFSVAAIAAFGKAAVDSASEQEQAEIKLAQALGRTSQGLLDQASALQKTTKFADEQIIAAQASLAMFTKNEAQLKQLTKATLDFAAAKGMDLTSAADIVGKSLGSEASMLGRYGVATEGAANSTARFTSIMEGLGARFGGQAEAQANTFSGSIAKMKNQFGETLEVIGNVIVKNPVVIKGINMMSEAFSNLAEWLKKNQVWAMELVQTGLVWLVKGFGYAVKGVAGLEYAFLAIKAAGNAVIYGLVTALEFMITPFSWVMDKLVAFGAMDVNPLAGLTEGIKQFRASSGEVLDASLMDIDKAVVKYDKVTNAVFAFAASLEKVKVVATAVSAAITPPAPPPMLAAPAAPLGPTPAEAAAQAVTWEEMYARIGLASSASTQIQLANTAILNRAGQMGANIRNAATKSMETQLLRLVETHQFSAKAIAQAIMQETKAQLIGLAAEAAVRALYFTAIGLAASSGPWGVATFGNPGAWFAAAGTMAGIAGAALAGAAVVNAISGPGAQTAGSGAPGSSPSNPTYTSGVPEPSGTQAGSTQVIHVTVNVHNPLSTQNWDEIMEVDIAPAILRAQGRSVAFA
jgi:hypothetical protein